MKRLLILLAIAVMSSSLALAQASNMLTPDETKEGWRLLFDGKTLNGWENHGNANPWKVVDGALFTDGAPGSWLGTTESFGDYQLRIDFRTAAEGNSGVFLRSHRTEGQPHITGYELQIWDFQPQGYLTGAFVNHAKADPPRKLKGGEWNTFDVTAQGDHFVVLLNGEKVLDAHDGKSASGVIGLQSNQHQIEFRSVKIRRLD